MKKKGSIVRKQTAPPAGPASAVAGFVGEVMSTVRAPIDAANLAIARATLGLLEILPKMPAARLYSDLVFQFGHSHPHPPTFGFPVPSTGPLLASGCMSVLINGQPAARNGDMGLAVWCGGYFPIFELITGSSHVFIGGARAARTTMDITLHCLPDPLGGKWGLNKIGIAMAAFGAGMSVVGALAASEQENADQKAAAKAKADSSMAAKYADQMAADGSISKQEVADAQADAAIAAAEAESAAASAVAAGVGAATAAAQAAADIAAIAMGLLMGKDPGVGFPLGMVITGSPNVLIGGFPMPGWDLILKGLFKLLRPVIRRIQLKLPQGKLRRYLCKATGHPVDVAAGRLFTSYIDFDVDGRLPIDFERSYDTSSVDYEGPFGWGWTHPFDQHLWESDRFNCLIWRDREGRQVRLDKIEVGEKYFQPLERVWLTRTDNSVYELTDLNDGLTYEFGETTDDVRPYTSESDALQLLGIRDRNDNRIELKYRGRSLVEIANGSGVYVSLHYHEFAGRSRIAEIRQHLRNGRDINLIKYGYNEEAELVSVVDRTYAPLTYAYADHLLIKETYRSGLSFYFEYEGDGPKARCIHTWGDGGIYERSLTYAPKERITRVVDGLGGQTVFHYNDLDFVTKIFNAEGEVYQFVYGPSGELLEEIDELGRTIRYKYDAQLNCTEETGPDGATFRIDYDEYGHPVVITDEVDSKWLHEFDEKGNITATINPLGARREYEYNRFGDIILYRDSLGNERLLEWTSSGEIASVTSPLGSKTIYSYDERQLLSEVTEEFTGLRVAYEYDDAERIVRLSEINSRGIAFKVERFEYDAASNLTAYIDPMGNKTIYTYSGLDKLAARTDATGHTRRFKYNREERLTEIINELGESYVFEFDLAYRVIRETGFDGVKTSYRYNQASELVYQQDGLGRETFYRRDDAGRLANVLHSDGTRTAYVYDGAGRIIEAENRNGTVRTSYDAAWQIVSEEQGSHSVQFEYDAEGRRTARALNVAGSAPSRVEYAYDIDGELSRITLGGRSIAYERDRAGRLTTRRTANGLQELFGYDTNGRVSSQKISVSSGGRNLVERGYDFDGFGNVISVADSLRGPRRYQHDAVERLSRVERVIAGDTPQLPDIEKGRGASTLPAEKRLWQADDQDQFGMRRASEVEEFRYDGDGNLLERNSNIRGKREFKYDAGDRLVQQDKTRYIYDVVGNLIQKQRPDGHFISYEYDIDNQLVSVSTETGGRVEFKYDAFGRRTAKITELGTTGFLWDGDVLLAEQRDSGPPIEYVHEDHIPLAKLSGSQIQTYHTDYLGTPKEVTDDNGAIIWQGNYDEYGNVTAVIPKTDQWIRFQGQYEDTETGLFYNRFRYYDPDAGRYINQDPIGLAGDENLYDYCQNPTIGVDPLGLARKRGKKTKWGDFLENNLGVPKPKAGTMERPHAHHIVFKTGSAAAKPFLQTSKAILKEHGIDFLYGKENLIWAPNKNHSAEAAEKVTKALVAANRKKVAGKTVTKAQRKAKVKAALRRMGKKFADDDIC